MSECATVQVRRAIEVAGGLFAPGHLGGLTPLVPFELVDAVLEQTRSVQRRLRVLPARVGVYLVLAMVLFPEVGLAGVWRRLACSVVPVPVPVVSVSDKALRDLRRRVGAAPVRALFEYLAGPVAWPGMPGVRYRGWRTVAVDGCSSFKVPDSVRNRAVFSRSGHRYGQPARWPGLQLLALVETGTRALIGAVFGPLSSAEIVYARRLVPCLGPDMLLLADRAYDADGFLAAVAETGAQFLVRVRACRIFPVAAVLPDGSFLTRLDGRTLRVIAAQVCCRGADGSTACDQYRLVTTLVDHRTDPAARLIGLYHERWEVETAFYGLRHQLTGRTVLRSQDAAGIEQEMWALLTVWQVLHTVIADAAAGVPGTDPDRCSFTVALAAARDSVTAATGTTFDGQDLAGPIGAAVLARPLPPRRARFSARVLKCPGSRYPHRRTGDLRPAASTPITAIEITITAPAAEAPLPDPATMLAGLPVLQQSASRHLIQALAILHADPGQPRRARDLARQLGISGRPALNAFGVAMRKQAQRGRIHQTAPGTYTSIPPNP